jgi:diadenosine tetraphosphate (Ap4A) HIT family hydrolase
MVCDIVAGRWIEQGGLIYENDCWQVGSWFWHPPVVWPGALSIKLKRHCEHLAELTLEEAKTLGPFTRTVCQVLTDVLKPANVYVFSFGDGGKHIHFWVLPQLPGIRPGIRSAIFNLDMRLTLTRLLGTKRWVISDEEVTSTAEQMRECIHQLLRRV